MSTQTMSRIILTVILLLMLSMACYWLSTDVILFGTVLLVLSVGGLLWVWQPWKRLRS
jgi:hypothetical protein